MSWSGKLQTFTANVPTPNKSGTLSHGACSSNCGCKCKCCRTTVQKFVNFNAESNTSPVAMQKLLRMKTKDLFRLLRVAQSRENFWSNTLRKINLRADYEALGAAFLIDKNKINVVHFEYIIDTITSSYRSALGDLSLSQLHGALRPKATTQTNLGLRCECSGCTMLPWEKLHDLETHQWMHKPSQNWHCCICFRRYFIQHRLLSHLSGIMKRDKPGKLGENITYKQLLAEQNHQELQTKSNQVRQIELPMDKACHEPETETRVMTPNHYPPKTCKPLDRRWECCFCHRIFLTRRIYLRHLQRVRNECRLRVRRFKCSRCKGRYQLEGSLKRHVIQSHLRSYKCVLCGLPSEKRCCDAHSPEECKAFFKKQRQQLLQQRGPPPPPKRKSSFQYTCHLCQRQFSSSRRLDTHMKRFHLKQPDVDCNLCDQRFYSQQQVNEHVRKKHGDKSYYCEPCGKTLKNRSYYAHHCDTINHMEQLTKLAKLQGKLPADAVVEKHVPTAPIIYCEPCDKYVKESSNFTKHCKSMKHKRNLAEHLQNFKLN